MGNFHDLPPLQFNYLDLCPFNILHPLILMNCPFPYLRAASPSTENHSSAILSFLLCINSLFAPVHLTIGYFHQQTKHSILFLKEDALDPTSFTSDCPNLSPPFASQLHERAFNTPHLSLTSLIPCEPTPIRLWSPHPT